WWVGLLGKLHRPMSDREKQSGVSAIVLAAGMSRRMGTPKQLLRLAGETILEHTLKNVRASNVSEIVLVLGHAAESVEKEISTERVKIVRNQDYQQGMGTSLRTGLAAVDASASAALIVLADQPFVRPETINQLIACHQNVNQDVNEEEKPQIVIPVFNGFRGNPVLLDRSVFAELQSLTGDVGCRAIFGNHTENIRKLAVEDIGVLLDIDSQEEYKKFESAEAGKPNESGSSKLTPLESRADLPADRPELIIGGRDAVAQALAKFGHLLNFNVTIVDPLLALAEMPDADRILHVLDFSLLPQAADRYVVVASRGLFDEEAIEQALRTSAAYVALLANKKRADDVTRSLRAKSIAEEKLSEEKLSSMRAPAGLNIGAESAEEIALSIMAEIVAVRHKARQ
ncbi:MAG TPA: NTP transferase domain-containing protein, partial [Candidatus Angelobacter sp.]|nr:NTP transferase domain-containing protein [Candidatus Angelobacter sp.]